MLSLSFAFCYTFIYLYLLYTWKCVDLLQVVCKVHMWLIPHVSCHQTSSVIPLATGSKVKGQFHWGGIKSKTKRTA